MVDIMKITDYSHCNQDVLTDDNPSVYLEIGYAWGKGHSIVLLTRKGASLIFKVRGTWYMMI